MEIRLEDYVVNKKTYNLVIDDKDIVGIYLKEKNIFTDIISLKIFGSGNFYVENNLVTKNNFYNFQNKISFIKNNFENIYGINNVYLYMKKFIKDKNLLFKDDDKKILGALKIVGLPRTIINKNLSILSKSELRLLSLSMELLLNPSMIILEEPFKVLDLKQEKKLFFLLNKLRENYNKKIIIISSNPNILYKYTSRMFFIKYGKVFKDEKTNIIYKDINFLTKNNFEIPEITLFTHKAVKYKKINLDYHKDVRDLIKDIYKQYRR